MKYDMTSVGEAMVRLSGPSGKGIINCAELDFFTGGAEANTAVALSRLGLKTAWTSSLTDNDLGRRIERDLASYGVDASNVIWTTKHRVGTYYVQFAAAPRVTTTIYDRQGSAFSKLDPRKINWDAMLDTRILHITGITPALSQSCKRIVGEAVEKARKKKIPISFDVNYRSMLWKPAAAAKALTPLIGQSTIAIMTREDAAKLFKIEGDPEGIVREIRGRFNPRIAVLTMGREGAICWDGKTLIRESGLKAGEAIDRLGAGDAFSAGFIFGFLSNDLKLGLKLGVAMSAMKLGMRGDYFWATRKDVENLIHGSAKDIVR